jgi:2-oxoglutarate dehydrogenase E1 component
MLALSRLGRRGRAFSPLLARAFQSSGDKLAAEPEPVPLSKLKDSFLDGTSSTYLEELEERYRANPRSVDKSWASFFHSMGETA